jgi:virginiamycin B lyase
MPSLRRAVFSIMWLFASAAPCAAAPAPHASTTVRPFVHPRVIVRPVRVAHVPGAPHHTKTPYLGTVSSIALSKNPQTITYDAKHDRFFFTTSFDGIFQLSPQGRVTLVASGFFNAVAFDKGTLYAAAFCKIDVIGLNGQAQTLAGGTSCGTRDGRGAKAQFQNPTGIAVDTKDGALYVTDFDRVRRVDPKTAVVTTFTPGGSIGGRYGGSSSSTLGIAYDANDDRFYLADTPNNVIRAISSTGSVTTLAGRCISRGSGCAPFQADGPAGVALFASPSDVAYDPSSAKLYVVDQGNWQVRALDASGNTTTLAGNGQPTIKNGVGLGASFAYPTSLAFRSKTNTLWVTDNALRTVTTAGPRQPPGPYAVTSFAVPSLSTPIGIAAGPGNAYLWFTETQAVGRLATDGTIVEYPLPAGHIGGQAIAVGADGNAWFADTYTQGSQHAGEIVRITPAGAMTPYTVPPNPKCSSEYVGLDNLSLGPDSALWFYDAAGGQVGRITTSGAVTTFPQSCFGSYYTGYVVGGLGTDVWLDQLVFDDFALYNTAGQVQYYVRYPGGPGTIGPDSNLWFLTYGAIGTYHAANGVVVLYPANSCVGYCSQNAGGIVSGPDQALWFAGNQGFGVGRVTTAGAVLTVTIPSPRSQPNGIAVGPDSNIWYVDGSAIKVGRISLSSGVRRHGR